MFEDGGLIAHQAQVVGSGEAAGATADNGDALLLFFCLRKSDGDPLFPGRIGGEAFDGGDIDALIGLGPRAHLHTRVATDTAQDTGQGVGLPDQGDCLLMASLIDQGDIAGDHLSQGAGIDAGSNNQLRAGPCPAAVLTDVFLVFVPEIPEG